MADRVLRVILTGDSAGLVASMAEGDAAADAAGDSIGNKFDKTGGKVGGTVLNSVSAGHLRAPPAAGSCPRASSNRYQRSPRRRSPMD
jgi:hypothetical protein